MLLIGRQIEAAFPTVAKFRHLGDFEGQAGYEIFAKIASEIWAIFGCEIIRRNLRFLAIFAKNLMVKSHKVLILVIIRGGDFWRQISPTWRILIKRSWEHWIEASAARVIAKQMYKKEVNMGQN